RLIRRPARDIGARRAGVPTGIGATPPGPCRFFRLLSRGLLFAALPADRQLEELGEIVDGHVVPVPADIFAASLRPRRIDRAGAIGTEERAGLVGLLDQLLAFARDLDDVALLELADRQAEPFGQAPDVVAADLHIACHLAAQAGTFETVERWLLVAHAKA